MDASVIILTKNGRPLVSDCLRGVFAQQSRYQFEVIAIDSGSTDGTLDVLQQYQVRLQQIPPGEFHHARTRNLGARLARGEFLVYLVQDAAPADPHWLERLVGACAVEGTAGACSRILPRPDASPLMQRMVLDDMLARPNRVVNRIADPAAYAAASPEEKRVICSFHDISSCLRRSVWELFPYPDVPWGEDMAWAKVVLEAGYSTVFEPGSVVFHSHDYNIRSIYYRSLADAQANYLILQRVHSPSLLHAAGSMLRLCLRDLPFVLQSSLPWTRRLVLLGYSPFLHASEALGYWSGSRRR